MAYIAEAAAVKQGVRRKSTTLVGGKGVRSKSPTFIGGFKLLGNIPFQQFLEY